MILGLDDSRYQLCRHAQDMQALMDPHGPLQSRSQAVLQSQGRSSLNNVQLEPQAQRPTLVTLLEDNQINQHIVPELLESMGVQVTLADNGQMAQDLLTILGLKMPSVPCTA